MTLRIGNQDMQKTTFLVNESHMGYLAPGGQQNHVLTGHRSVQLLVGLTSESLDASQVLSDQREKINLWHTCSRETQQRGIKALPLLMKQYHIQADWLIGLDDQRAILWLGEDRGVYLLRQGMIFQAQPLPDSAVPWPQGAIPHRAYAFPILQDDALLVLPPAFLDVFAPGEVDEILSGLRQLPIKMNDLIANARLRHFQLTDTWTAIHVQRIEPDTPQPLTLREQISQSWPAKNHRGKNAQDAGSLYETGYASLEKYNSNLVSLRSGMVERQQSQTDRLLSAADLIERQENETSDKRTVSEQKNGPSRSGQNQAAAYVPAAGSGASANQTGSEEKRANRLGIFWQACNREQKILVLVLCTALLILLVAGLSRLSGGSASDETTVATTTQEGISSTTASTETTQATTLAESSLPAVVVSVPVSSLNIREQPSKDSALITTLSQGDTVIQLAEPVGDWVQVQLNDGRQGYAYAAYLLPAVTNPT